MKTITNKSLGFGLGLRPEYYQLIESTHPAVDWFELNTEDYLIPGGRPLYHVKKIREHYPMVIHGVALSIGSADPLNFDYLRKVKKLAADINAAWISDHLCWTGVSGHTTHDLLPLPYTQETLKHVVTKVQQAQDFLGEQICLENVSSYISYQPSEMTEWDFLTAIVQEADCKILLDINNIFVSAFNHDFDPLTYLNAIPRERVQQFHIAGHSNLGDIIIDTHDHRIVSNVWDLYVKAVQRFGAISTMIERDARFPPFPQLLTELQKARQLAAKVLVS